MERDNGGVNFPIQNHVEETAQSGINLGDEMHNLNNNNNGLNECFIREEEFKTWKNHSSYLYDFLSGKPFEWPSLTVQWLPVCEELDGKHYSIQKIILGTHTDRQEKNYLMIAEVQIPHKNSGPDYANNGLSGNDDENIFEIRKKLNHNGDVNIARYMPQKDSIIATKTDGGEVFIFDTNKQVAMASDDCAHHELKLLGHKIDINAYSYGLSWNNLKSGYLLSGDYDGKICIWDINVTPNNLTLDPLQVFKLNEGVIDDIAWNSKDENLFGSVGEKNLQLWDVRAPIVENPVQYCVAHSNLVNCLSFNPFKEWSVLTGSCDKTIKLWDTRMIGDCVHTFKQYGGDVFQVGWNPNNENVFASGCHGKKVVVWDISRIGATQSEMDVEDGPSEMLFVHCGHMGKINDISWSFCQDMMIASVDNGNFVHVWNMSERIYKDGDCFP